MRRSMLIAAVALSSLPLLASGANAATTATTVTNAATSVPAAAVVSPGRATPALAATAIAKAMNAADGKGLFALNCAEDQRLFATVNTPAEYITVMNEDLKRYTSKVTLKPALKNKTVPIVITTTTKVAPVTTATDSGLLTLVNGNWCLQGLGDVAYAVANAVVKNDLHNVALQVTTWLTDNPSKQIKPFVVNAAKASPDGYVNGDKNYPVSVSDGTRIVVSRTAAQMKTLGDFCLSGTSVNAKNPVAPLVFNSSKGGLQPAGATC